MSKLKTAISRISKTAGRNERTSARSRLSVVSTIRFVRNIRCTGSHPIIRRRLTNQPISFFYEHPYEAVRAQSFSPVSYRFVNHPLLARQASMASKAVHVLYVYLCVAFDDHPFVEYPSVLEIHVTEELWSYVSRFPPCRVGRETNPFSVEEFERFPDACLPKHCTGLRGSTVSGVSIPH